MQPRRRGRGTIILSIVAIAVVLVVAGYALYLANMAGRLPWQEEPTRIPVTPFANLGGGSDDNADVDAGESTPVSDARWRISDVAFAPLAPGASGAYHPG